MSFTILASLMTWHAYAYSHYSAPGTLAQHISVMTGAIMLAGASLLLPLTGTGFRDYLRSVIEPISSRMIGLSCILMGGLHFVTMANREPVFIQMGYMILLLAYFEVSLVAIEFRSSSSGDASPVTRSTLRRLLANQAGTLTMAFAMSVGMLYLSLMVVVGFVETWSVAVLCAVMILALALLTMARRL